MAFGTMQNKYKVIFCLDEIIFKTNGTIMAAGALLNSAVEEIVKLFWKNMPMNYFTRYMV